MLPYIYQKGEIRPKEEAKIDLFDLGLLRGYSIFDFFPIYNSEPVFFEDYLRRFRNSARQMKLSFDLDDKYVYDMIIELTRKNNLDIGYTRFLLTGGNSENGFTPSGNTNFLIMQYPDIIYGDDFYDKGVKLITHEYVRHIATIKTTNYVEAILNGDRIKEANAFDLLFVKDGIISESSRSNFFIVTNENVVVTAEDDILEGITRKRFIEFAEKNYSVEIRDLHLSEVRQAKEAFMTSTTKGAVGVVEVDDITIADGKPGPITKQLQAFYLEAKSKSKKYLQ